MLIRCAACRRHWRRSRKSCSGRLLLQPISPNDLETRQVARSPQVLLFCDPACVPCACSAQRDLSARSADLTAEREANRREREGLERRADALQQVRGDGGLQARGSFCCA
jgi:hypothetical protein